MIYKIKREANAIIAGASLVLAIALIFGLNHAATAQMREMLKAVQAGEYVFAATFAVNLPSVSFLLTV